MQRSEPVLDPSCHNCHFMNELGCEIDGSPTCAQCKAPLEHEALVRYIDSCPLCGVSFEDGKPYAFKRDASQLNHWMCRECQKSPRGIFYQEFEQARTTPEEAPPCRLCGLPSKLIALTHASDDGEFICEACSASEAGKQMIKEHYETER